MSRNITVKDPSTGELVELTDVPDDITDVEAHRQHFGLPEAPKETPQWKKTLQGAKGLAEDAATGIISGFKSGATFWPKAGMGLAMKGAELVGREDVAEKLGAAANQTEDTVESILPQALKDETANAPPNSPLGGYVKAGTSGATSALMGGPSQAGSAVTAGLGATSGVLAQAGANADLSPGMVTALAVAPQALYGGYRAAHQPAHITEIQQALKGLQPEEIAKAKSLMAAAQERGVDLSPAQLFGDNHPLVATLNRVGGSWGGSSLIKNFLRKQEAPVNAAVDSVTDFAGNTRSQEASALAGQRATELWGNINAKPGNVAKPLYEAAKTDKVDPSAFAAAIAKLDDFAREQNFAPTSDAMKQIELAKKRIIQGTLNVDDTRLTIGPDGVMKMVPGIKEIPQFPTTGGAAKSVRDDLGADFKVIKQAGTGSSSTAAAAKASKLVKEASQTSPKLAMADKVFANEMKELAKERRRPIAFLAGKNGIQPGEAFPNTRLDQFLDPKKFSPEEIDLALTAMKDPKNLVVTAMLASKLNSAVEKSRAGGGTFTAPNVPSILRGSEGSGKKTVLDSLITKSIQERNATSRPGVTESQNPKAIVKIINDSLDVAEASGRGRQGLTNIADVSKSLANTSPVSAGLRASAAGPLVSQVPTYVQAAKFFTDKATAKVLTDPSLRKLLEANDYSKLKLIANLVRESALVNNAVGE